uniref:CSON012430 protein n=1 Tax=Culicoides sonorensis TaxID=179676 RepID=A0A336M822_CULSO
MIKLILVLSVLTHLSFAANILFLGSIPSPSHHNWNKNLYYALAKKGHNITILTPDADKHKTDNVHFIQAEGVYEFLESGGDELFDLFNEDQKSKFTAVIEMWGYAYVASELVLKSQGFQRLFNYPDTFKFDLVVIDYTCAPTLLGFLEKFNYPPVVGITAFSIPHYTYHFVGGHKQPSYVPHYIVDYSNKMNFIERINNYLSYFIENTYFDYVFYPKADKLMKKHFKNSKLPYITELGRKMSLALVNTHYAIEKVEPLPANVIPVAGLQIKEPKRLDNEIEVFVNASSKGTVLFSLGTNVKSEMLSQETKETFMKVFKDLLDYHFLWKYESDLNIPLPKNVKIQPWLKQNDILAHPKTKAFISHCGLLGTQEATWWGIPIIGMPFFADQHKNLNGVLNAEAGVKIHHRGLTYDTLKAALLEVLENPKYLMNAKKRGSLFRDQPDKPLDRALYWLEWAMRHKDDVQAIESPVKHLSWFVTNGNDVLLCLIVFVTPMIYLVYNIIRNIYRSNTEPTSKTKKD